MRWFQTMSMGAMALWLVGGTAQAEETGTRVTIQLAQSAGTMPDAEKLVQSVTAVSGERQVRVMRKDVEGASNVQLDLWGAVLPAAEIPGALRDAFPVLAQATIQTSTLDASQRPTMELREGEEGTSADGNRRIIKKKVVIEEKK